MLCLKPKGHNSEDDSTVDPQSGRIGTRRAIPPLQQQQATGTLTPPILAGVLLALAAIAVVLFLSSSRQSLHPIFTSSNSGTSSSKSILVSFPHVLTDQKRESIMSVNEQTFIAIKPDGVHRGLIGPIISRFENRGFKLVAMKLVAPSQEHLETHYADLKHLGFFPGMIKYMKDKPMCAMIWEGRDAVKTGRSILGATDPLASAPGTIRGDYALDKGRNVCHGSDSVENAQKEIALWFKKEEILKWDHPQANWVFE